MFCKECDQVMVPWDGVIGDAEGAERPLEVEVTLRAFVVYQVPGQ